MTAVSTLIDWFDYVLFGNDKIIEPPAIVSRLVLKLDADGIRWRDGNITNFFYEINGDLHTILDHLNKNDDLDTCPIFKTIAARSFYLELVRWLTIRESRDYLPEPSTTDRDILDAILAADRRNLPHDGYESARFWGELAKTLLNHRRPTSLFDYRKLDNFQIYKDRLEWLYELTCQSLGTIVDPMTMVMVSHDEHVDAEIWRSADALESFVLQNPEHDLSKSVSRLVNRNLHRMLEGTRSSFCSDRVIDTFLANVSVVDDSIPTIRHDPSPPKTIDVFQRLLALTERDYLWKNDDYSTLENKTPPERLLGLVERILVLERQNRLLTDSRKSKL
jgi:hypothetical protein